MHGVEYPFQIALDNKLAVRILSSAHPEYSDIDAFDHTRDASRVFRDTETILNTIDRLVSRYNKEA